LKQVELTLKEDPFFPIQPGGVNYTEDGALVGDAWPYSPRLQGRKNVYSILPF
jgi:hypothetical protein